MEGDNAGLAKREEVAGEVDEISAAPPSGSEAEAESTSSSQESATGAGSFFFFTVWWCCLGTEVGGVGRGMSLIGLLLVRESSRREDCSSEVADADAVGGVVAGGVAGTDIGSGVSFGVFCDERKL